MSASTKAQRPLSAMRSNASFFSSAVLFVMLLALLVACQNPLQKPQGKTYVIDEGPQPPAPPAVVPPQPETSIRAAEAEAISQSSESNQSNQTAVTFVYEKLTPDVRYFFQLLPTDYVPDAALQSLHTWQPEDGNCGEQLNVFKKNQVTSEKFPKLAMYARIECVLRCKPDDYLVNLYPVNASAMVFKNFSVNKDCTEMHCLGSQAGWNC